MESSTLSALKSWLAPVVSGLVSLMAAGTVYLNHSGSKSDADSIHASFDKRLSIVENQTSQIKPLVDQLTHLTIKLNELLVRVEVYHNQSSNPSGTLRIKD